jgi:TRAP-type C4-dicarboxylate transport system permease small subunit
MHNRTSLALALAIMALSAWGVFSALAWPWKAKLFPLVIGIPLFFLALAEALWVIFGRHDATAAADFQLSADQPAEVARRRTLLAAAWMIGFFAAIVLLGFQIAVPLLVALYLRLQGKEGWLFTVVFTAAVWACFYGLFDMLLHLHFPPGWLFSWLGGG